MTATTDSLKRDVLLVLIAQAVLMLITAAVIFLVMGGSAAFSAIYGSLVTLAGTGWTGHRVDRASTFAEQGNLAGSALVLYGGVVQRYLFVLAALAVGMGLLKLSPLPLLAGFVITHLGYLVVVFKRKS
jgi:ATP synthase protein I